MPKIYENGKLREMTQEEVEKTMNLPPPEDPNELWKTEIEAALIELAAMLGGA
jgi:hypothetical protein